MNAGGRPQRLLFASTGTKDPKASDVLYVEALAAPFTVNTMPEGTLLGVRATTAKIGATTPADGGDCEAVLARVQGGRRRRRRARGAAAGRGREVVREVVERADGRDRRQERGARQGGVSGGGAREAAAMNVLVIDVGGTHVKILATGHADERRMVSGPTLTAAQMVAGVRALARGWKYDAVAIGYPGPVRARPARRGTASTSAAAGSASTSRRRSAARCAWSTTPRCRRSAATAAARCCSSVSAPASARR